MQAAHAAALHATHPDLHVDWAARTLVCLHAPLGLLCALIAAAGGHPARSGHGRVEGRAVSWFVEPDWWHEPTALAVSGPPLPGLAGLELADPAAPSAAPVRADVRAARALHATSEVLWAAATDFGDPVDRRARRAAARLLTATAAREPP